MYPNRLKLTDLNPHLTCALCGGYYVDATTIVECLHSFCKACIVRYLQTHKYCPVCEVQVHKTKPLENIRSDQMLQDIVYKVVPRLFENEMKCRRDFYSKHPGGKPTNTEDAGEAASHICSPDEPINLSLEYFNSTSKYGQKRYFRCPAAVTVSHLQKLIRSKFELSVLQQVDIMYMGNPLESELSLMDITYIYAWKRKGSLQLSYCIFDEPNKRIKLDVPSSEDVKTDVHKLSKEMQTGKTSLDTFINCKPKGIEHMNDIIISKKDKKTKAEQIPTPKKKQDEWKEVQLQISENGVMLVRDIHKDDTDPTKEGHKIVPSTQNGVETTALKSKDSNKSQLEKSGGKNSLSKIVPKETTFVKELPHSVNENNVVESNDHKNSVESETSVECNKEDTEQVTNESDKQMCKSLKILEDNNVSITTSPLQTIKFRIIPSHITPATQGKKRHCSEIDYVEPESSVTEPYCGEIKKQNSLPLMMKVCPTFKPDLYKSMSKHKKTPSSNECGKPVAPRKYHDTCCYLKKDSLKMAIVAPTQLNKKQPNTCSLSYQPFKIPYRNWNPNICQVTLHSPEPFPSSSGNVKKDTNSSSQMVKVRAGPTFSLNSTCTTRNESNNSTQKAKPPQLSKIRNVPRYLGNPASGVKPMYQVAPYDLIDNDESKNTTAAKQIPVSVTKSTSTISNPVRSISSDNTSSSSSGFTASSSSSKFSSAVQSHNLCTAMTSAPSFPEYINSLAVNKSSSNTSQTISTTVSQNSKLSNSLNVPLYHSYVSSSANTTYHGSNFPVVTSANNTSSSNPVIVQNRLSLVPSPTATFHLVSPTNSVVWNHLRNLNMSEKLKLVSSNGLPAVQRIPPSNTQSRSNKLTGNTIASPLVSQSVNKTSVSTINKCTYIHSPAASSTTVQSDNVKRSAALNNNISKICKDSEGIVKGEIKKSESNKESISQTVEPKITDLQISVKSPAETSSNKKTFTRSESSDNTPEPLQPKLSNNNKG